MFFGLYPIMDLHLRTGALEGVLSYETPQGMIVRPMATTAAMNDLLLHAIVYRTSPSGIAHITGLLPALAKLPAFANTLPAALMSSAKSTKNYLSLDSCVNT